MSVLNNFKLVQLITTRTDAVATFMSGNYIKFNNPACADLGYPPYVQLFIDEKNKQFAIKASLEEKENTVPYSKPAGQQKYPPKVACGAASNAVRKIMGWGLDEAWNVPGALFADEGVIIFALEQAYKPAPKTGGRQKANAEEKAK